MVVMIGMPSIYYESIEKKYGRQVAEEMAYGYRRRRPFGYGYGYRKKRYGYRRW